LTIEQTRTVDIIAVDHKSNDAWLVISDHLGWNIEEHEHLILLQDKVYAYLDFIESGEFIDKYPNAASSKIGINLVSKFPLSRAAETLVDKLIGYVGSRGYQFKVTSPGN